MEHPDVVVEHGAAVLDQELSDEDLEAVVGGLSRVFIPIQALPSGPGAESAVAAVGFPAVP